jgi:hypothetical protein
MGWAERANRGAREQSRVFDREAARGLADRLRSGLNAFEIPHNPAQPIWRMVSDLQWIAGFSGEPFDPGGVREVDPERFDTVLLQSLEAREIGELLHHGVHVRNSKPHVSEWIRKRILGSENGDSQAQDKLFEMVIASRFVLWNVEGLDVSLEEPDIVIRMPSEDEVGPIALACKRPRSPHSFRDSLHDAVKQIRRKRMGGIVVVSLDAFAGKPGILTGSNAEAEERGDAFVRSAVTAVKADIEKERDRICVVGVHFSARFLHRGVGKVGHFWSTKSAPDLTVPAAERNLVAFDELLLNKPAGTPEQ